MCLQNAFFIKVNKPLQSVRIWKVIYYFHEVILLQLHITLNYRNLAILHITFKSNILRN